MASHILPPRLPPGLGAARTASLQIAHISPTTARPVEGYLLPPVTRLGRMARCAGTLLEALRELSLELLASDDFLDVEVAARRLAGMRAKTAVPALQRLAAQTALPGAVDQHFRAARMALTRIKGTAT